MAPLTTTPRLYVGTYDKYNSGSIGGAWVDLEDFSNSEEFYEHCRELHKDEADPEFMFQDFEGFPKSLFSESGNIDAIYEYIDCIIASYLDQDVIDAGLECGIPLDKIEEAYMGSADSDEAFAHEYADAVGAIDHESIWPNNHIDWEAAARYLMMDFTSANGHYFSNVY